MPLGYRALFTVPRQHAADLTSSEVEAWLVRTGQHENLPAEPVVTLASGATLTSSRDWSTRRRIVRYRLEEHDAAGRWVTTVTTYQPRQNGDGWTWVEVDAPADYAESPSAARYAPVSELVTAILTATPGRDHLTQLTATPIVIAADTTGQLLDALRDPDRQVPILLFGPAPDGTDEAAWAERAAALTCGAVGLAGLYLLTAEAATVLTDTLGPAHAVPAGGARIFLPRPALGDPADGRRHRELTARTVAASPDERLTRSIATQLRRVAVNRVLPGEVSRTSGDLDFYGVFAADRAEVSAATERASAADFQLPPVVSFDTWLAHQETKRAVEDLLANVNAARDLAEGAGVTLTAQSADALVATTEKVLAALEQLAAEYTPPDLATRPAGTSEEAFAQENERTRRSVERATAALDGICALVAHARTGYEHLVDAEHMVRAYTDETRALAAQVAAVTELFDQEQEEHEATEQQLRAVTRQRDQYRATLLERGLHEDAWADPGPPPAPSSMLELLTWLTGPDRKLVHVEFTGDPDAAAALDEHDPLGRWAARTWDALQALDGYAQAVRDGAFTGGDVRAYLMGTPSGYATFPAGAHVSQESETVQNQRSMRRERDLPVPHSVHPAGHVKMLAHFRIATRGTVSPRMHYYDNVSRTGKVYVGYIGRHLTNTRTN